MNTEKITLICAIDDWANSDVGLSVIDYPDAEPVANSYIIAPGTTVYLPVATRINQFWADANNGGVQDDKPSVSANGRGWADTVDGGIGTKNKWINTVDAWTAEIIWTDISGGLTGKVTLTPMGLGKRAPLKVEVAGSTTPGNVVIGVKKGGTGDYLWSWHLWITDFNPNANTTTMPSGLVVMDRDLGQLDVTVSSPTSTNTFGLLYQWGRKDPFLGKVRDSAVARKHYDTNGSEITSGLVSDNTDEGTLLRSIENPITFYKSNGDWIVSNPLSGGDGQNRWGGNTSMTNVTPVNVSEKTIYDPCPEGWRVMYRTALGEPFDGVGSSGWVNNTGSLQRVCNRTGMKFYTHCGMLVAGSGIVGAWEDGWVGWTTRVENDARAFRPYVTPDGVTQFTNTDGKGYAFSVRPCKI